MTPEQETLLQKYLPLTTEPMSDPGELFSRDGIYFGAIAAHGTDKDQDAALAEAVKEIVNAWPVQREILRIAIRNFIEARPFMDFNTQYERIEAEAKFMIDRESKT